MKSPCILILAQDSLIKRAVASIMDAGRDLEVVVSEAVDISELTEDISKIRPDALLIGGHMTMAQSDSLLHLRSRYPQLTVVVVSEKSNTLRIYGEREILLTSPFDLIDSIHLP